MVDFNKIYQDQHKFTGIFHSPNNSTDHFILEQTGRILIFNQSDDPSVLLDLTDEIQLISDSDLGERGLLSLAFHPEFYHENSPFRGIFVVMYSNVADPDRYPNKYRNMYLTEIPNPDHMTCISMFTYSGSPEKTKSSRTDIICIPEPESNHNGGGLVFGPDGYLWIGLGDGGGANDEHGILIDLNDPKSYLGNAQNLKTLHGKILRIHLLPERSNYYPISSDNYYPSKSDNYQIPSDNPISPDIGCPEIAHWGVRNPWRMSFAGQTLLIGDVGQDKLESVKAVDGLGKNLLWRGYEGNQIFNSTVAELIKIGHQSEVFPIVQYPREMGIAIVGVIKYQGSKFPNLRNKLIIADYSGRIMIAEKSGLNSISPEWKLSTLLKISDNIHSINQDGDNKIYISHYDPEIGMGYISELIPKITPKLHPEDIEQIIKNCVTQAKAIESDFRLESRIKNYFPASCRIHVAIILTGQKKAKIYHSMENSWPGSKKMAKRKAYTAYAFSSNQNAMSSQNLQNFPHLISKNDKRILPITGGFPLYKQNKLVGALGIAGDGEIQDEIIGRFGCQGYEPPGGLNL